MLKSYWYGGKLVEREVENAPKGLPRPIVDGLPLVYTSDVHGTIDEDRQLECVNDCLCLVCGDSLDSTAIVVVYSDGEVLDAGGMHEPCAKITVNLCPHIRNGIASKLYAVKEIPTSKLHKATQTVLHKKGDLEVMIGEQLADRNDLLKRSRQPAMAI